MKTAMQSKIVRKHHGWSRAYERANANWQQQHQQSKQQCSHGTANEKSIAKTERMFKQRTMNNAKWRSDYNIYINVRRHIHGEAECV